MEKPAYTPDSPSVFELFTVLLALNIVAELWLRHSPLTLSLLGHKVWGAFANTVLFVSLIRFFARRAHRRREEIFNRALAPPAELAPPGRKY